MNRLNRWTKMRQSLEESYEHLLELYRARIDYLEVELARVGREAPSDQIRREMLAKDLVIMSLQDQIVDLIKTRNPATVIMSLDCRSAESLESPNIRELNKKMLEL